jgi:hypothetical protein
VTSGSRGRDVLERMVGTTPDCIPIERLGEARTDAERSHLETCARCQAELALWQEFEQSTPSLDDGAAVQWIAAELGRRRAPKQAATDRVIGWLRRPRFAAAMATLVVAAAAGYVLWDPEPRVGTRRDPASEVYRTARVQAMAPLGDVASAPHALEWASFPGAVAYDVTVLEVDRTPLLSESTPQPRIEIPPSVFAMFVPGKTVLWEVKARDTSGSVIGESGPQQFRVAAARSLRNP